tara:strand:- start:161 stop:1573 length:1413 start_codon:yes stop_codon:yes gene_type:complete
MSEVITGASAPILKPKIKLKDTRVHLSDKFIQGLPIKTKQYSKGDDTVIGLRIFVFAGSQKTFYYCYTDKNKDKQKEKIGNYPSINTVRARNQAKEIAYKVTKGQSAAQIKRSLQTELTVNELFTEFEKVYLRAPKYEPSSIKKWLVYRRCWINKNTTDKVINGMFSRSKQDIGRYKLSQVNMDNLKDFHSFIGDKAENSANSVIEMLSVVFNYAVRKKMLTENPVQFSVDDFYEKKENNNFLTREQLDSILDMALKYDDRSKENPKLNHDYYTARSLNPVSCLVIAKACVSGGRPYNEGASLKWNEVSFPQKKLLFSSTKTGQQQYNIGPRLHKLLTAIRNERFRDNSWFWYPNDARRDYVFPSYNYGRINNTGKVNKIPHVTAVRKTWKTILAALNIDYIPFYNVRHSYLTDALSKTKNLKLVKEIAGHKKIQTTERYARILGADVTDALNTIDGDVVEEKQVIPFKK